MATGQPQFGELRRFADAIEEAWTRYEDARRRLGATAADSVAPADGATADGATADGATVDGRSAPGADASDAQRHLDRSSPLARLLARDNGADSIDRMVVRWETGRLRAEAARKVWIEAAAERARLVGAATQEAARLAAHLTQDARRAADAELRRATSRGRGRCRGDPRSRSCRSPAHA